MKNLRVYETWTFSIVQIRAIVMTLIFLFLNNSIRIHFLARQLLVPLQKCVHVPFSLDNNVRNNGDNCEEGTRGRLHPPGNFLGYEIVVLHSQTKGTDIVIFAFQIKEE